MTKTYAKKYIKNNGKRSIHACTLHIHYDYLLYGDGDADGAEVEERKKNVKNTALDLRMKSQATPNMQFRHMLVFAISSHCILIKMCDVCECECESSVIWAFVSQIVRRAI